MIARYLRIPEISGESEMAGTTQRSRSYGPATVRSGGQVTVPVELRRALDLREGTEVTFYRWDDDSRVLVLFGDAVADAADAFVREGLRFPPAS
jgi:AbrB family looped-hinge helix DNA binding protein